MEGYQGLPAYYSQTSDPTTPNLGLALKAMDPIVAENFVIIDTAYGSGSSIEVNGVVVPAPANFINSASVTLSVLGSNISLTSAGGGSSIQVNGSTVSNPNFNGTTPAALTNTVNVQFQVSGSSVSGYVPALVPNKTLYVDNTRTDIFTPNGTIAFPFATITAAINQVIANGDNATYTYLIDIQPSVYAETINIGNASLYNLMFEGHGLAGSAYASSGSPMPGAIVQPASGNALQGTSNVDQIKVLQFSGLTFIGPVDITDTVSDNIGENGFAFVNCCFDGNVTVTAASGYAPLQFISSSITYAFTLTLEHLLINWINSDMNYGTANLTSVIMEIVSWAFNPQNLNINAGSSVTAQDGVNIGAQTVTVASGGSLTLINAIVIANLVIDSGGTVTNYLGAIEGTITNNGTYTIAGTATNFSADIMNAGTGFRINSAAASGHYLRGNGTNYIDGTIQAADVPTLNQNTTGTAANLSGTPALPNGTTATTQVATDATTLIATDAFVQNAIDAAAPLLGIPWFNLIDALDYNQVVPWYNNGSPFAIDTGISRISAGVLGIGTGAQGSIAGSLSLANATISGLTTASAITGSLAGLKLATPSAPTITPNTSGGGTSYSYKIVAKDQNGTTLAGILSTCGSIASTAGSTSTGQSVLSGSVYNTLAWAAVTGAVSYDVYRTVGGATQGYIGNTSLLTFNDTGLTGNGWTAPAYNTSGSVVEAFDSQAGNGNFFTSIGEVWKAGAPTGYVGVAATNRVDMTLRYVSETMIVNKITVLNSASANASETAGFGMYDQNLNLVAHTTFAHTVLVAGGTPTAYSSAVLEATPPTIVPGWYWFALTSSGTTISATFGYYGSSATAGQYLSIIKNVTRITRGGNAASAGVLPATQTLQGTNDGLSGLFVVYET